MLSLTAIIAIFGVPIGFFALSRRGRNLLRATYNLALGNAESANVPALIALAEEDLLSTEQKFNNSLADHAGQAELLMRQVNDQRSFAKKLEETVKYYVLSEDEENAGKFALQYEALTNDLQVNEEQLEKAETAYRSLIKLRDEAISAARARIEDMKTRTKRAELIDRTNELQASAAQLSTSFSDAGNTLSRLDKMVKDREALSIGRSRVIGDSQAPQIGGVPNDVNEKAALERFVNRNAPKQLNEPVQTPSFSTKTTDRQSA